MISRTIHKQRTGRRVLTALAIAGLVAGTLGTTTAVLAVHDEGVFELEGNAVDGSTGVGTGSDPANRQSQVVGIDWDAVYAGTSAAEATSFVTDTTKVNTLAGQGDSILSTNTKDIQLISDWQWKQNTTTSVQDKADIEHAYAAQFVVDKTGEQCGTAPGTDACALLYFGADRFSNSGDTVMGFWFFKSGVTANPTDASGNGTFSGAHTARTATSRGDILIVADFRSGGKAPQIQIYEWVTSGGSASTHLDQIGGGTNPASCTQAPPEKANGSPVPPVGADDNFCATANQYVVTSPWPFLAKDNSGGTTGTGGSSTKFGIAEFMEGGINMTALGLGDQCFSSFMAETRSSHSVTSTLSDFALGTFGSCGSSIATTPQTGAGSTLTTTEIPANARVSVRDHAVITVSGTDGAFAGSVKFFLCGPLALDSTGNCSTGGVQIGTPAAGETVSGSAGTATVDSDTATLTSAGRYCWRAEYSGDSAVGVPSAVDPAKSVADGGATNECFTVTPVTPTLTTAASADVTLGSSISDTASLTGTAKQPGTDGIGPGNTINATAATQANAGGTISFTVKGPDSCTASGLTVSGSPVTVDGDNSSYGPVSATPTAEGKYTFVASYTGSSPNTLGAGPSSCPPGANDGDEEVLVGSSSTVTTPNALVSGSYATMTDHNNNNVPDISIGTAARVSVHDHAAITVTGIPTWTGSVTFHLCGPLALGSSGTCATGGVLIGATPKAVSNSTTSTDSDAAVLTSVGYYCWRADFSSTTSGVPGSADARASECFEVLPVQPVLTTTASADTTLGNSITDTASLTGTAKQPGTDGVGGAETISPGSINATAGSQSPAGGTISWSIKGPNSCVTTGPTLTPTSVSVSGDNASYGPVSATPTSIGTYVFIASYNGSSPNTLGAGPSSCPPGANDGDESVTITGVASLATAQRWLPNDTAHVTGPSGSTLSGTVTFTLYNDGTCGTTGGTNQYSVTRNVVTDALAGGTANDRTVTTANTNVFVTATNDATAWSWKVSYDDAALTDPSDSCEVTTAFTLND